MSSGKRLVTRRIFSIPGPESVTKVRFEDREGGPGAAELVTEGSYKGLWRDHKGGYHDWPNLLVNFEPLEEA